ncbi:DNA-3-methyladenine glycosylase I, partial [Pandoraea pnomenusa]|uniref:DNA-3-methyladenine glycosylase I n=1 Tax=Pandoraea pnomenusa TaxID=93220 RepID=UPI001AC07B2D
NSGTGWPFTATADVEVVEPMGSDTLVWLKLGGQNFTVRVTSERTPKNGDTVSVGFDPMRIAAYGPDDEARLMANAGIVRNRLKVAGVIKGARAYLAMEASGTRFSDFVWQFVGGEPLQNRWTSLNEVPASTAVSDAMSKALKKAGFTFVGSTICYSFMQASGMVNDHLVACPRHKAVKSHPGAASLLRVSPPRKRRAGASSATIAPDESGSA